MSQQPVPTPLMIAACSALAVGGMLAHNVLELGPAFLLSPETLLPVALYIVLAWLVRRPSSGTGVRVALLSWALLNLVVGGILSVLPLDLLPFVPEQSVGHYAAHALYAVAQVPLVFVAVRALPHDRGATVRGARG